MQIDAAALVNVAGEMGTTVAGTTQTGDTGSREFARLVVPDGVDLSRFRKNLVQFFNSEELDELIFDFNLHTGDFDSHVSAKAREIITWAVQRKRVDELIAYCQRERPEVEW